LCVTAWRTRSPKQKRAKMKGTLGAGPVFVCRPLQGISAANPPLSAKNLPQALKSMYLRVFFCLNYPVYIPALTLIGQLPGDKVFEI